MGGNKAVRSPEQRKKARENANAFWTPEQRTKSSTKAKTLLRSVSRVDSYMNNLERRERKDDKPADNISLKPAPEKVAKDIVKFMRF